MDSWSRKWTTANSAADDAQLTEVQETALGRRGDGHEGAGHRGQSREGVPKGGDTKIVFDRYSHHAGHERRLSTLCASREHRAVPLSPCEELARSPAPKNVAGCSAMSAVRKGT